MRQIQHFWIFRWKTLLLYHLFKIGRAIFLRTIPAPLAFEYLASFQVYTFFRWRLYIVHILKIWVITTFEKCFFKLFDLSSTFPIEIQIHSQAILSLHPSETFTYLWVKCTLYLRKQISDLKFLSSLIWWSVNCYVLFFILVLIYTVVMSNNNPKVSKLDH